MGIPELLICHSNQGVRMKRKTWWDKLPEGIRHHVKSDAGVRSLAALRRTVEWQYENGGDCGECKRAATIVAADRGENWGR